MSKIKKPARSPKETITVSVSSKTIELLDIASVLFGHDNRSKLVERPIKEHIVRKLSENPLFWAKVYDELNQMSL